MSDNAKPHTLLPPSAGIGSERGAPSRRARMVARLRANKFDRMAAVGGVAPQSDAYAAHCARLMSTAEREAVARALRRIVRDARGHGPLMSSRVPLHVPNIAAAEDVIDEITLRLHSPRPVGARGMARLRILLADGAGPVYRYGRGDLVGRLGAAMAEL
ncbi:hypothetical protein H7I77_26210 [Mycolicibacterium novocastrense]|uniref:Uncharacterized protein n=1 Tax=Mycolicibacterium novocastrense TaxID=59813 RepID=A0AAW5SUJ7_MYCNV|nr:hypothetical protein [Mycolicibacterium novocastrense]MCV7026799.1 hypothetical protein [Mycolicibacterium novocastrense]GAT10653.1 uncharacterized protein RMCN_3786 [Mycolicibacterium novocastrense]